MIPNFLFADAIIVSVIIAAVMQSYEIYEILNNVNLSEYRYNICKNIKNIRKEHYEKYKQQYPGSEGDRNPYSTENVASYLGLSKVHYKRLENENDKNKFITLDNLIKLSIIHNVDLKDFNNLRDNI